jgi:hypothetical protein
MPDRPDLTRYFVAINYRTQHCLGYWSDIVTATSSDDAGELAEKLLHQRRRTIVRIDRIVVR